MLKKGDKLKCPNEKCGRTVMTTAQDIHAGEVSKSEHIILPNGKHPEDGWFPRCWTCNEKIDVRYIWDFDNWNK